MKILIIDDSSIIPTSFRKFLEIKKHDCIIANNGVDGLQLILEKNFDVILLDIHMPEMNGIEVLETLNEKIFHVLT